ncbi:hypothetical protein QQZ08_009504 [Neonectria magnoliae]|uniref:Uncharacterized protein n=1 Tax=Neonectria magnoliae TaxID=2732573 RepID=A0ABR1HN80_9HYPO
MHDIKRGHEVLDPLALCSADSVLTVCARDCSYNGLPHIETRYKEKIDRDDVHGLLKIIIRHNLDDLVGVHNLHRHDPLPADTVRVEKDVGHILAGARMTPPVPLDGLDLGNTRALTYYVSGNNLIPFEFREGQNSASAGVMNLTKFVAERGLTELFAIEIGDFTTRPRQVFKEVEIANFGTIVVPSKTLALSGPSLETAWDARGYNEETSDNDGSTVHQYMANKQSHKVFTNKFSQGPKAIIDDLFEQGVLKA